MDVEKILNDIYKEDLLRESERIDLRKRKITEKKYRRKKIYKNQNISFWPMPLVEVSDKKGVSYIKKCNLKNTKPYQKYSNKIIRQYKGEISNGGSYKKFYDLWWTMY